MDRMPTTPAARTALLAIAAILAPSLPEAHRRAIRPLNRWART